MKLISPIRPGFVPGKHKYILAWQFGTYLHKKCYFCCCTCQAHKHTRFTQKFIDVACHTLTMELKNITMMMMVYVRNIIIFYWKTNFVHCAFANYISNMFVQHLTAIFVHTPNLAFSAPCYKLISSVIKLVITGSGLHQWRSHLKHASSENTNTYKNMLFYIKDLIFSLLNLKLKV